VSVVSRDTTSLFFLLPMLFLASKEGRESSKLPG
jgi:hypothetical protein